MAARDGGQLGLIVNAGRERLLTRFVSQLSHDLCYSSFLKVSIISRK